MPTRPTVAIVGAGASGTLAAIQLLRTAGRRSTALEVVLLDPADRWGRGRLLPIGLAIGGASAAALAADVPVVAASLIVVSLSLGYDMTQPLLAGIVTNLAPNTGQAMGLNVFTLFTGFGLGSLVFSAALVLGLTTALALFGAVAVLAAVAAVPLFRAEVPDAATSEGQDQRS